MKKFIYSMQSILNLQYELEEQEKAAFREANDKLAFEEDILRQMFNQMESYENQLRELMSGPLNLQEVRVCKHGIDIMKSRIRTQMIAVHMAEKNVEAARIRLTEAVINRKTQERMREKAFDEYKIEMASEEAKEIDELVSYTHSR